jgi:hypothetical protein
MRTVPPVGSVLLLAVSMRERVLPVRPGRRSVAPKRRALHPTSADAACSRATVPLETVNLYFLDLAWIVTGVC